VSSKIETSDKANLPTKYGKFIIKAYKQYYNNNDDCIQEHLAIMSLDFEDIINSGNAPFVRVHSECLTGDTLGSLKCDCQNQLHQALDMIAQNGGLVIYHRQEGRNIGLLNKVNAYCLQDDGLDTIEANIKLGFEADQRDYSVVKYIFEDLNISKIKLVTNNPGKIEYIQNSCNVDITERIPSITQVNQYNKGYLKTKKESMGHLL
jgi:GTP cyclohydrolase II